LEPHTTFKPLWNEPYTIFFLKFYSFLILINILKENVTQSPNLCPAYVCFPNSQKPQFYNFLSGTRRNHMFKLQNDALLLNFKCMHANEKKVVVSRQNLTGINVYKYCRKEQQRNDSLTKHTHICNPWAQLHGSHT